MRINRRTLIAGAVAVPTTAAAAAWLLADSGKRAPSDVSITTANGKLLDTANGMPNHAIGDFPNWHDLFRFARSTTSWKCHLHPSPQRNRSD